MFNPVYYKAESGVRPAEVDTTSSKVYVYLRRNIEERTREDPFSVSEGEEQREPQKIFVYEEAKLTKEEYVLYLANNNTNTINMQTQLAIAELAATNENNYLNIQLAIAELASAMSIN